MVFRSSVQTEKLRETELQIRRGIRDNSKSFFLSVNVNIQGVSKKRGPFFKLVQFLFLSRNLHKILYGCSKMILLCSSEYSI